MTPLDFAEPAWGVAPLAWGVVLVVRAVVAAGINLGMGGGLERELAGCSGAAGAEELPGLFRFIREGMSFCMKDCCMLVIGETVAAVAEFEMTGTERGLTSARDLAVCSVF